MVPNMCAKFAIVEVRRRSPSSNGNKIVLVVRHHVIYEKFTKIKDKKRDRDIERRDKNREV